MADLYADERGPTQEEYVAIDADHDAQIVKRLNKTRQSIANHLARGLGLGYNGNINQRGCELCDRYDDLRKKLTAVGGNSNQAWKDYCDSHGSSYRHTGHDLFA